MVGRAASFIRPVTSSVTYHVDGTRTVSKDPAVWTLAHKGYSGGGRLDVWAYPTRAEALRAGAQLALECGMDEDAEVRDLFASGRYQAILDRYEAISPGTHLLRVQPAFLQSG